MKIVSRGRKLPSCSSAQQWLLEGTVPGSSVPMFHPRARSQAAFSEPTRSTSYGSWGAAQLGRIAGRGCFQRSLCFLAGRTEPTCRGLALAACRSYSELGLGDVKSLLGRVWSRDPDVRFLTELLQLAFVSKLQFLKSLVIVQWADGSRKVSVAAHGNYRARVRALPTSPSLASAPRRDCSRDTCRDS